MARTYQTQGTAALKPSYSKRSKLRVIETPEYERTQAAQHPHKRLHPSFYTHEIGVEGLMVNTAGYRIGRTKAESKLLVAIGGTAGLLMFVAMALFSLL